MSKLSCRIEGITWDKITHLDRIEWPGTPLKETDKLQIIQAANSVGKTTTLYLIRHILTGIPPDPEDKESSVFQRARYKEKGGAPKGHMELKLNINNNIWYLGIKLDYKKQKSEFYTVDPDIGNEGVGWSPPDDFKEVFYNNMTLATLLLLDTQKAGAQNRGLSAEIVDRAILNIANLSRIREIIQTRLPDVYEKRKSESEVDAGVKDGRLDRISNGIKNLKEWAKEVEHGWISDEEPGIKRTKEEIKTLKQELDDKRKEKKGLENEAVVKAKKEGLEEKIESNEKLLTEKTENLLKTLINPSNLSSEFWGDVTSYYEQLHDFRIPEFITKEIVDTIKQRDKCICGTNLKGPKSAIHIKHLEDFREKMTGASIATEAYAIKDTMRLAEENKPDDISDELNDILRLKSQIEKDKKQKAILISQLGEGTTKKIEGLEQGIRQLEGEIDRHEEFVKYATMTDFNELMDDGDNHGGVISRGKDRQIIFKNDWTQYKRCTNLPVLKRKIKLLEEEESELVDIRAFKNAYEDVQDHLQEVQDALLNRLKKLLTKEMQKIFPNLTPTSRTQIYDLFDGIRYENELGEIQPAGNTGMELSAQFSFLMALQSLGEINIPIIIDNPTKGLDGPALKNFQKGLFERMNEGAQCIIFLVPTERNQVARFVSYATSKSTLKRKDETYEGVRKNGDPPGEKFELTEDIDWFNNYHPPEVESDFVESGK